MTTRTDILKAAAEGKITLANIEDGADFENVEEWLEYAGEHDIEEVAIDAGLIEDTRPDINELNYEMNRRIARDMGIKGA